MEGELATKAAEADRLRARNDQLTAENTRLTDLTRMLLSSPHFSTFLDELSANRGAMPSFDQVAPHHNLGGQAQTQPQPSQVPKDANPLANQNDLHVGLATIPEGTFDNNMQAINNNNWSSNSAFDQRVFAVTELPEEPVISGLALSGKGEVGPLPCFGSKEVFSFGPCSEGLDTCAPVSRSTPLPQQHPVDENVEFNESDPAFELFSDMPAHSTNTQHEGNAPITIGYTTEKAEQHFVLVSHPTISTDHTQIEQTMAKLDSVRRHMDSIGSRIESLCGGM